MVHTASSRTHVWEDLLDDETREIYSHYEDRLGLKDRPALLCIDNYNAVFGDRREPTLEAIERFPSSCGPAAWDAIDPTRRLMAAARTAGIPLIHTTRDDVLPGASGFYSTKRRRRGGDPAQAYAHFEPLAPQANEPVVHKSRASAFFGTTLITLLTQFETNTLLVCGNATSGCVRATVGDAYMYGYRVGVVEDCVFDRNPLSHKVNLFDMNAKYADVMFLGEVLEYLGSLKNP